MAGLRLVEYCVAIMVAINCGTAAGTATGHSFV